MGCCYSSSNSQGSQLKDSHFNHSRVDKPAWDEINPEIGFVIKSRRDDQSKVFINIFFHSMLKRLMTLPLMECKDKTGQTCEVYGVIVPLQVFTKSAKNGTYRDKVIDRRQLCHKIKLIIINSNISSKFLFLDVS